MEMNIHVNCNVKKLNILFYFKLYNYAYQNTPERQNEIKCLKNIFST